MSEGSVEYKGDVSLDIDAKKAIQGLNSLAPYVEKLTDMCLRLTGAVESVNEAASKTDFKKFKSETKKAGVVPPKKAPNKKSGSSSSDLGGLTAEISKLAEANIVLAQVLKDQMTQSKKESQKERGLDIAEKNYLLGLQKQAFRVEGNGFPKLERTARSAMAMSLKRWNDSLVNSRGLMGFMARIGERAGSTGRSYWSNPQYRRDSNGNLIPDGKGGFSKIKPPKRNFNSLLGLQELTGGAGINLGGLAYGLGFGGLATAVGFLTKKFITLGETAKLATGEIQMIKTQMSVVMGSDSLASRTYEGIEKYALKSPFGVAQSADMATLLKQSGVNAADLLQTLKMIGDTSSGNAEKMKRVANNYAQIQAIGKASMLDMRQFAYAGIPIYKEVADYMKVSQVELRKMISEGKVTANVIEAVFKRMTGAGGTFENATMRGAQTLKAREQNLQDAKMIAQSHFGEWYMNFGGSEYNQGLGNFILNFKEALADFTGGIFKQWNINDNFKKANSFLNSISSETEKIDNKMPGGNGIPSYSGLSGELRDAWINANGGIEKAQKDLAAYVKSYGGGKLGLTRVSDAYAKERQKLYNQMATRKNILTDAKGETARQSQSELENHLKFLEELEKTMVSESEFKKNFDFWEKFDKRAFYAYSLEEVESARVAEEGKQESLNKKEIANARYFDGTKILKSFDSLAGQFNTLYKQTPYGKWDELQKKEDERTAYNKTYAEFSKYQDNNNNLLKKNIKTLDELNKVLSSGMFKISDTIDTSKMTEEQRKTLINNIDSVIEMTIGQMKNHPEKFIGLSPTLTQRQAFLNQDFMTSAPIISLLKIKNAAKNAKTLADAQINTTNALNRFIQFDNPFGKDFQGRQLTAMLNSFQSEGHAKSDLPPDLRYRLAGGSLGMNAWRLPLYFNSPADILKFWNNNFAQRDIVRGMMPNLVASNSNRTYNQKTNQWTQEGFSLRDLASTFVSNGNIVDWEATRKNMEKMAFSSKASISSLEAYGKIIDSQTSKLTEFYTTMVTGGETLDEKIRNGRFDKELETAFATKDLTDSLGRKIDYKNGKLIRIEKDGTEKELTKEEIAALGKNSTFMTELTATTEDLITSNNNLARVIDGKIKSKEYWNNYKQNPGMAAAFNEAGQLMTPHVSKKKFTPQKFTSDVWNAVDENGKYTTKTAFVENAARYIEEKLRGKKIDVTTKDGEKQIKKLLSPDDWKIFKILKDGTTAINEKRTDFDDRGFAKSIGEGVEFHINDESKIPTMADQINDLTDASQEATVAMTKFGEAFKNALSQAPLDALNNTMAKFGENIAKGVDGYEDMDKVIKNVGKSMMSNLAAAATQAGLSLISSGKIGMGMALIAAGGITSFLGGLMSDSSNKDDDISQKLKDLKQDLADLLKQAREDAIYYENHLRHTNALSYNTATSKSTKVNDAIITPQGNVITTHPEDYLIASKNPSGLVGNAVGTPIVNIAIENNSGKQISMKQEKRPNNSGGFDVVAIIEEAVGDYVSSSRSDDAFAAREARLRGRSVSA
ncbi:MAG: tape measure protein [Treponema sp.]|nr:tape measure protein [Treponema sp.]